MCLVPHHHLGHHATRHRREDPVIEVLASSDMDRRQRTAGVNSKIPFISRRSVAILAGLLSDSWRA